MQTHAHDAMLSSRSDCDGYAAVRTGTGGKTKQNPLEASRKQDLADSAPVNPSSQPTAPLVYSDTSTYSRHSQALWRAGDLMWVGFQILCRVLAFADTRKRRCADTADCDRWRTSIKSLLVVRGVRR